MFLYVDIKKSKQHIDLIKQEIDILEQIIGMLQSMERCSECKNKIISAQLEFARKQEMYIHRRIALIETIIHETSILLEKSDNVLNEAIKSL